jgi:hypothetical protein
MPQFAGFFTILVPSEASDITLFRVFAGSGQVVCPALLQGSPAQTTSSKMGRKIKKGRYALCPKWHF